MLRTSYVLPSETARLLESGCALIVGTVSEDGAPHASRAWGLTILPADDLRLRLVFDADDVQTTDNLADGGALAVTATSVPTLRSVQLKGMADPTKPATASDLDRVTRFCDDLFGDITSVDGIERALLERLVPARYVTCDLHVDELFDQTPGPGAGASLDRP